MSGFLEQFAEACKMPYHARIGGPLLRYVTQCDEKALQQVKKSAGADSWSLHWLKDDLWKHLARPSELCEEEKRAMHAIVVLGQAGNLVRWLKGKFDNEPQDQDAYLNAYLAAFGSGTTARAQAAAALIDEDVADDLSDDDQEKDWFGESDGQPNPVGRYVLSLDDEELAAAVEGSSISPGALRFLLRRAPDRVPGLLPDVLFRRSCYIPEPYLHARTCAVLLEQNAARYEQSIAAAFRAEKELGRKFDAGVALSRLVGAKYQAETREAARAMLASDNWAGTSEKVCQWLIEQYQAGALDDIAAYLGFHKNLHCTQRVLVNTVNAFGVVARPAVFAALANADSGLRLLALEQLTQWSHDADRELIVTEFRRGFEDGDAKTVISFIVLAGRSNLAGLEESLWALLEHKSKPVRAAAARVLARLGDEAVSRASGLLSAKKASVRSAAVAILSVAQTPAAVKALEGRLDEETDEEVRDQILLALDHVWEVQGKKITRKQIDQRMARTADKLEKPVADWMDGKKLPSLCFSQGGEKLAPQAVRYLLYRQSRAREMRPDIECKPLYALIDRKTSGDFALAVLRMFLGSKMAAEDRWALAVAGILGDDRIVTILMSQIRAWVDGNRGKLAEYAAQALALLGTDTALCAVDSLSIRYRSKQKNIGKAAAEAFAEAAERLGITVDELGDRVVPWLGFERGQPRLIEHAKQRIEVRIGLDFKLELRDLVKGKKIASLPAGIPAPVKTQFKDLAATLREVLKGQLIRLENLMVRQFRWPVDRWQELFLTHPVLFPFAARLVWGIYSSGGELQATFRALEDHTLTNERDESVALPAGKKTDTTIGIIHPLELSAEKRQVWAVHLADYSVQSPFLQLERPVIYAAADEKSLKMSPKYKNSELNAMTFKGRAERLGWQRGSVCDGGGVSSYHKSFPGAGADVILEVEGMYVGIDMYSSIQLGRFYFVKSGSVSTGSYVYDEPADEKDPRLLNFGEVPPIVFSETLGDLEKIAGKKGSENDE